jgi:hypothetical protein
LINGQAIAESWRKVLGRIETTNVSRPKVDNVVTMPKAVDSIRQALLDLQSEATLAAAERADIDAACDTVQKELQAHYERNALRQREIATRRFRLQQEWAAITRDLGMRCDIDQPPQAVFSGGEGEPE